MNENKELSRDALELVAGMFKIFADASRLEILQALKSGPKNVGELVNSLNMTQANVSKHLRIMHDARLLSREKVGTSVFYSIDDDFIEPLCSLVCEKLSNNQKQKAEVEFLM